jgi:hypothetical protein
MKTWIVLGAVLVMGAATADAAEQQATLAGGCFWCIEAPFDKLDGVISAVSGFSGGSENNPTYRQVASGGTSHLEVVQVRFDPDKVSYQTILDVFWRQFDSHTALSNVRSPRLPRKPSQNRDDSTAPSSRPSATLSPSLPPMIITRISTRPTRLITSAIVPVPAGISSSTRFGDTRHGHRQSIPSLPTRSCVSD